MEDNDIYNLEKYSKVENLKNKINIINSNKIKNIIIAGGFTLITSLCFKENEKNINFFEITEAFISSVATTTSYIVTMNENHKLNKEKIKIKKMLKSIENDL